MFQENATYNSDTTGTIKNLRKAKITHDPIDKQERFYDRVVLWFADEATTDAYYTGNLPGTWPNSI